MASLTSIINRAVDTNTVMGVTKTLKAKEAAVSLMRSDPEATDEARYVAATKLILDRTTRTMRQLATRARGQGSFFNLHERYALDVEGKVIKDTDRLRRLEWQAILKLREKQIADDTRHFEAMKFADAELGPIWDEFPDKIFKEVEEIYLRRRRAAA